jgi:hypothetical protein
MTEDGSGPAVVARSAARSPGMPAAGERSALGSEPDQHPTLPPRSAPSPVSNQPEALQPSHRAASEDPARLAVPPLGAWRYRVEGNWSAGLAGSPQSFAQDATTHVSRHGGPDDEPELQLVTTFQGGSYQEVRRYRTSILELVSARFSSAWLSFGGEFSVPLPLMPWPPTSARSWRVEWRTQEGWGESEFSMAGQRRVAIAERSFTCYLVRAESRFHGSTEGSERMEACWVPELGMSADDHHEFQGTYQGVRLQGRWHSRLLSATAEG